MTKTNTKSSKATANRRFAGARGSASEEWLICEPLMEALLAASYAASLLSIKSGYKRGGEIVALTAETMRKINVMLTPNTEWSNAGTKPKDQNAK